MNDPRAEFGSKSLTYVNTKMASIRLGEDRSSRYEKLDFLGEGQVWFDFDNVSYNQD